MQQHNILIGPLVDTNKRGELRLPGIQFHYIWRATRVRDLFDYLYLGYPTQGESSLESLCVSASPELWSLDNYRNFLKYRRESLAECMNQFIQKKSGLSVFEGT